MALPSPQPPDDVVEAVAVTAVPSPLPGCQFAYEDGRMCLDLKIKARNLCDRHYAQLRRLGAFEPQRTARTDEALANINADRLTKARDILERAAPLMARTLIKAAKVAADKGLHKAPLDVLIATEVISPPQKNSNTSSPALTINVGVKLAGQEK